MWVGLEICPAQGAQMLAHGLLSIGPLPVTVHHRICRADVLHFSYPSWDSLAAELPAPRQGHRRAKAGLRVGGREKRKSQK